MTKIYLGLLDPERKKIFLKLKPLARWGTLAGGTALFLQLKHRWSVDFDIFFEKHVIRRAFNLATRLVEIKGKRVDQPDQITFLTKEGIQITFIYYEFSPLYPRIKTPSLPLFYYKDIAADKAYTLGHRPVWRDYVDLFFLFKDGWVTLKDLIRDAGRKFGVMFAPKLFLEQLTYYGDIKDFKTEFISKKYSPGEIQKFLKSEVSRYTKKNLLKGV